MMCCLLLALRGPVILISVLSGHARLLRGCVMILLLIHWRLGINHGGVQVRGHLLSVGCHGLSRHILGVDTIVVSTSLLLVIMFLLHVSVAVVVSANVSLVLEVGLIVPRHLCQLHVPPDLLDTMVGLRAAPKVALVMLATVLGRVRNRARAGAGTRLHPTGECLASSVSIHHLQHPGHPSTAQQTLHALQVASVAQEALHVLEVAQLLLQSLLLLQSQSQSLSGNISTHQPSSSTAPPTSHLCLQPVLQVGDLESLLYHPLGLLLLSVHLGDVNLQGTAAG